MLSRHAKTISLVVASALWIHRSILGAGFVLCVDPEGGSRLEFGCAKTPVGCCVTACGVDEAADRDAGVTHQSHACTDTPLVAGTTLYLGKGSSPAPEPFLTPAARAAGLNLSARLASRVPGWRQCCPQGPHRGAALQQLRTIKLQV